MDSDIFAGYSDIITIEECYETLKTFKNKKSPGNDGLTIEFYRKCWPLFGTVVVNSFNYSYNFGQLSTSQKQAIITLIDKKKDRIFLKNWRPISFFNVDYKLLSKTLSNRLTPILSTIIHPNLTGFMKGRNIAENIRILYDSIYCTKKAKQHCILLALDFEKAFDSLEWNFIFCILEKFNFDKKFIKWIRLLYNDISSCTINNGTSSGYFSITRGVRQGYPMSPYLFILSLEALAQMVRDESQIKGLEFPIGVVSLLLYADDVTRLVAVVESANLFFTIVNIFGQYLLNMSKTEALWIGENPSCELNSIDVSCHKQAIKILGVFISNDMDLAIDFNLKERINTIRSVINNWKRRNLTLIGKIVVLKTFIISQFQYVLSAIHITEKYIKEINNIMFSFLWNGKKAKIKKSILCQTRANGGLSAPDFKLIMLASRFHWLKNYCNSEPSLWKKIQIKFR